MLSYLERIEAALAQTGLHPLLVTVLLRSGLLVLVVILSWIFHRIARRTLERTVQKLAVRTETKWDDVLVESEICGSLSY